LAAKRAESRRGSTGKGELDLEDTRHVFLVPGLFGFAEIGGLRCFAHVRACLARAFDALELPAEIHEVRNSPTASIPKRAVELLEAIRRSPAADSGEIHLIGHSAGGLDARMLATPSVSLRTEIDHAEVARRIRTVTTVATPHHGTPLAGYLATPYGRQLADLLTLATLRALAAGEIPPEPALDLSSALTGLDHGVEVEEDAIERIREQLRDSLPADLEHAAQGPDVTTGTAHALFEQLTPSGIDLFNAATTDRDTIRYGSVITAAPQPALKPVSQTEIDPRARAGHGLFAALNRLVGRATTDAYRAHLSGEQAELLQRTFGSTPSARDNDGVVPSVSQLWGKPIHAALADHFDVLGHFEDSDADPPHREWLASGARFDRLALERLWADVARFVADDEGEAA